MGVAPYDDLGSSSYQSVSIAPPTSIATRARRIPLARVMPFEPRSVLAQQTAEKLGAFQNYVLIELHTRAIPHRGDRGETGYLAN